MVCGQLNSGGFALPWNARKKWFAGTIDGIDIIALPIGYSNRISLAKRAWLFWKFAWRGMRLALRERDYDVLFATSTPLTAALPGIAMKLLGGGRPFVFEVRDLWPELPRALGMKNPLLLGGMSLLEWLAYRWADVCVGLSPGIVEGIRKRAPVGRRVELVPNGCDLDLFHPRQRTAHNLPGVQAGDFVAGFTGAHGVANGLDAVVDAGVELQRRGRLDIKLVLIGDGNQKDRLVARAKAAGLDNVLFLPPVKKTEVAGITASFDCGLMILANVPAFYYGTSPNKFFDYIAAGIPVVNNCPGWLAGLIGEHKCGIAVPPNDPAALADALERLAEKPDERQRMGQAARRLAESEFDRSSLAARWIQVIEGVAPSQ
jgi:glycosyltransferase involved in cell wall biosynthesis